MTEAIQILKPNHSFLRLRTEPSIEEEIREEFSFFVPNYKFMPSYKNKMWDGKIYLFDRRTKSFPAGLYENLVRFARSRGYSVTNDEDSIQDENIIEQPSFSYPLTAGGNEIEPRDYQQNAVTTMCRNKRGILLSPTGSGKSLMIYLLIRNFESHRFLIVVPTTNLVEQMYSDFDDYSSCDPNFNVSEDTVQKIYSGKDKDIGDRRIVITTWQSIHRFSQSWFEQFTGIIGDEAHTFKAKSLASIMEKSVNADVRIGTTGTLDGTQVHEMVLKGHFGPVYRATSTKELIDEQTLSDTEIHALILKYSEDECKRFRRVTSTYADEIAYLVSSKRRNNFLINLALSQKTNTLLLFNYVENHGKPLRDLALQKTNDDRPIYFISGEIDAAEREQIRQKMESDTNALLIASLGTFSTGINIKNLHNIIFASPTKSQIRVLQSIGRGLRKHDGQQTLQIYDIVDDLTGKRKKQNYAFKHGVERAKIYRKEQFSLKTYDIRFG